MFVCLTSLVLFSSPSFARPRSASNVAVTVQQVQIHEISQSLSLVGKLKAQQSVTIAPEVSGTIEHIAVSANQEVKKGQLLIRLSDDKAKAAVKEAKAYLSEEKRKLGEFERLRKSAAVTLTALEGQKASVQIAQARLDAAQAELNDKYLRAPFAGHIGFIDFSLGKLVNSGTELMNLDNLSVMELDLQVPERYLSMIANGMKVNVLANAWGDRVFEGKIVGIDSRVNPETLNLRVRIDLDNTAGQLKPGMLVQATMKFPPIQAPIIPVQSLQYLGTKRFVYVLGKENRVTQREVFLGTRVGNEVVIDKGLEIGETIVVQGVVNMRSGIVVKIVGEHESESKAAL
ncbi:efflux RND transporter periplasmic adaptor subunit [Vibrio gallicus]|uniref:efflux RND transporter periplasmic adaptor subunit n=1 Tax=Vibrio gallicus TaxID=190897 RepID=UPI0021C3601A|nr:efflux RND transporter periplasmic adaptor subunit [Vibrio gallicus]